MMQILTALAISTFLAIVHADMHLIAISHDITNGETATIVVIPSSLDSTENRGDLVLGLPLDSASEPSGVPVFEIRFVLEYCNARRVCQDVSTVLQPYGDV